MRRAVPDALTQIMNRRDLVDSSSHFGASRRRLSVRLSFEIVSSNK